MTVINIVGTIGIRRPLKAVRQHREGHCDFGGLFCEEDKEGCSGCLPG